MSTDRVLLPQQLYPSHYSLELVPDLEKFDFTCNQEIDVTVRESTNEVTLHTREIFIESVCFKSASAEEGKEIIAHEFSYNNKYHTVKISFGDEKLPTGEEEDEAVVEEEREFEIEVAASE
jgi:aminopeptidase 2